MNIKSLIQCSLICSMSVTPVFADPYQEGYSAAVNYDYKRAMEHWGPLAQQGYAEAQFQLALMFHGGLGVPMSESEAVKWYRKAAENGHTMAQEYLAAAYAEGWFGLPKDPEKAAYWSGLAEAKKFAPAAE